MNTEQFQALVIIMLTFALFDLILTTIIVIKQDRKHGLKKEIMLDGDIHFIDENGKARIIIKRSPTSMKIEPLEIPTKIKINPITQALIDHINEGARRAIKEKAQKGKQQHGTESKV